MAVSSQTGPTFDEIIKDVRARKFKPVYLLMGLENYYIDRIVDEIVKNALTEEEQAFNLNTFYGSDASINDIINSAQSFPMGAECSVVLVKEAQSLKDIDNLTYYLQNVQPTTILVIVYKNGVFDRRKKVATLINSIGVLYDSQKVKDTQLPTIVKSYALQKGFTIDEKSAEIIADAIGADLIRLYGEMDKLFIAMSAGQKNITPETVERNIGISKDFNYFEFQNALVEKNAVKAFQIGKYFEANPKASPIQLTLSMLFRFFSTLMMAYYAPQKTLAGIAQYLGMQEWQVRKNVYPAMHVYSARKVLEILDEIRATDEKSKGLEGSKVTPGDNLKQLIAFILD